jgi:hypothetical protein
LPSVKHEDIVLTSPEELGSTAVSDSFGAEKEATSRVSCSIIEDSVILV